MLPLSSFSFLPPLHTTPLPSLPCVSHTHHATSWHHPHQTHTSLSMCQEWCVEGSQSSIFSSSLTLQPVACSSCVLLLEQDHMGSWTRKSTRWRSLKFLLLEKAPLSKARRALLVERWFVERSLDECSLVNLWLIGFCSLSFGLSIFHSSGFARWVLVCQAFTRRLLACQPLARRLLGSSTLALFNLSASSTQARRHECKRSNNASKKTGSCSKQRLTSE